MTAVARRLAIGILVLFGLSGPAPAQSIDGIIKLFGTAIEHDMRRQEQLREQQAVQRQQQQEHDEARRREIAAIKRLQSALASLGFYAKAIDGDFGPGTQAAVERYQRAFGMGARQIDISEVEQIEEAARVGFRSRDEVEQARQGGFSDRATLVEAARGGFATHADYVRAREAGFEKAVDFVSFRSSGFTDPAEFRAATNAGFATVGDWTRARAAGFDSRKDYEAFVASGLPDRTAWLADKARQQSIVQARTICLASVGAKDDLTVLRTCGKALALAPTDQSISEHVAGADSRLEVLEADLVAQMSGAAKAGTAARLDAVRVARAEHACSRLLVDKAWAEAAKVCSEKAQLYPGSTILAAASTQAADGAAKSEAQKAAADEKAKREAEAEQGRLALTQAAGAANALLDTVGTYSAAGNRFAKGLEIARGLVQLRQAVGGKAAEPIEQALLRLEALLQTETAYQTFVAEKAKSEQVAQSNAAATAMAESQRIDAFIQDFVALNVTHDSVEDLLEIQIDLSDAIASADPLRMATSQSVAANKLAALGLDAQLAAYNYIPKDAAPTSVQKADNGLAVAPLNEAILSGDKEDIVILHNTTPAAAHAIRNLVGELTFEGGAADTCWYHDIPARDLATNMMWKRLQDAGVRQATIATCAPETLARTDIVMLRRGDFLAGNILYSKPFVDLVEKGDFAPMSTVKWSEVGIQAAAERQLSADIERDVLGGTRDGFGWLRLESDAPATCVIVPSELNVHEAMLSVRAPFAPDLPDTPEINPVDLERAFYAIQRGQCSVVYAASADLGKLLTAVKRDRIAYSVLPIWVAPQDLAALVSQLEQTAKAETAELEAARARQLAAAALEAQTAAARATLNAARADAAAASASGRQTALRSEYAQEANGAYNALEATARGFFDASQGEANGFGELFPGLAAWQAEALGDGWEFAPIGGEILDYGTAAWKDRRTEVVFARFDIPSSNRVLGEKKTSCFVVGYIIDAEFQVNRDPFEADCNEAGTKVAEWKQGRAFESRWNAE